MSIKFLVLGGGGILGFGGGGECRFHFYGRADFSDTSLRFSNWGVILVEISAFSHQNTYLQALFQVFSTKCLAIDLSAHSKGCYKGSLGSVIDPT